MKIVEATKGPAGYRYLVLLDQKAKPVDGVYDPAVCYERTFPLDPPDGCTEAEYLEDQVREVATRAAGEAVARGIGSKSAPDVEKPIRALQGLTLDEAVAVATDGAAGDRQKRIEKRMAASRQSVDNKVESAEAVQTDEVVTDE